MSFDIQLLTLLVHMRQCMRCLGHRTAPSGRDPLVHTSYTCPCKTCVGEFPCQTCASASVLLSRCLVRCKIAAALTPRCRHAPLQHSITRRGTKALAPFLHESSLNAVLRVECAVGGALWRTVGSGAGDRVTARASHHERAIVAGHRGE